MSRRRQRALAALVQWTMPARGAPSKLRRHTKPAPYRVRMLLGCFPPSTSMNPCTLAGAAAAEPQAETARRDAASAAEWRQSAYSSDCLNNIAFAIEPLLFAATSFVFWRFGAEIFLAHHKLVMIELHKPDATPNDAPQTLVHSDGIQLHEPRIHKSVHRPGI